MSSNLSQKKEGDCLPPSLPPFSDGAFSPMQVAPPFSHLLVGLTSFGGKEKERETRK